jgi:CDGSH-type Zn-finger protein
MENNDTSINLVKNGPYRVKGEFTVYDEEGNEIPTGKAMALCACGQTKKKPFCDGTHKTLPGFEMPTT